MLGGLVSDTCGYVSVFYCMALLSFLRIHTSPAIYAGVFVHRKTAAVRHIGKYGLHAGPSENPGHFVGQVRHHDDDGADNGIPPCPHVSLG